MSLSYEIPPVNATKLRLVDLDEVAKSYGDILILNDMPMETQAAREALRELTVTSYDKSDVMSNIPSCLPSCRKTMYGFNKGKVCPYCNTEVKTNIDKVTPDIWIEAPTGIRALVNPNFWHKLQKAIPSANGNTNIFTWLVNRTMPDPTGKKGEDFMLRRAPKVAHLRGLDSFIEHFDFIFEVAMMPMMPKKKRLALKRFVDMNRTKLFPRFIPVPNKVNFVVEDTHMGQYYDKSIDAALEAIFAVAGINRKVNPMVIENRMVRVMELLSSYHITYNTSHITPKSGAVRRGHLGARLFWSARDIVTSTHEPHDYKKLKIPYALAAVILHTPLMNKLTNQYDMTHSEGYQYLERHAKDMDPLILKLLLQVCKDTPEGRGLITNLTRYPSLRMGSSQTYYVIEFTNSSTQISVLRLASMNMDFDGDQGQLCVIVDRRISEEYLGLEAHFDMHCSTNPGSFSNTTKLPDNSVEKIHRFIESEDWVI